MAKKFLKIRRSKPYQYLKDKYLYSRAYFHYKLNPYPAEVGENPIFIFNHIPKCGGTSLNIVLRKWFYLVRDYPPHDLQYPDPEDWEKAQTHYENNPPNLANLKPFQILAGHYHHSRNRFTKRIGNSISSQSFKCVTFLRDPLSHRLSLYKFGVRKGHNWVNGYTLNEYIKSETNFFARVLECDETNYKEILRSYFFVGILEKNKSSIDKLGKLIGRSVNFEIPHVNQTNSITELDKLSQKEIDDFKIANDLDYKIYQFALERLNLN